MSEQELADELTEALNGLNTDCGACDALEKVESDQTRDVLITAMAGTIGTERLSRILKSHGLVVSERQIKKHRREEHS